MPDHSPCLVETPEAALARYRVCGDRRIRNRVVEDHRWFAKLIAREFNRGSEPLDDLIQVACIGLLKAAERFDPAFGVEYRSFAGVTVRGELRRHYRDATWAVHVPRRLQELRYEIRAAADVLSAQLRRSPDTAAVAAYLHVTTDEVIDALCARSNIRALSIDHRDSGDNLLGRRRPHHRCRLRSRRIRRRVRRAHQPPPGPSAPGGHTALRQQHEAS